MATTITFGFGSYNGRPTLDMTGQDTESLDFGAYDGRPSVYKEITDLASWYHFAQEQAVA